MNTQTLRTLRTGSLITICLPPVCHGRHKTVHEFIVIVGDNHISTFTDVKFARTLCQSRTF